jgi:SPP1 family predicted phage head-tail adaptor
MKKPKRLRKLRFEVQEKTEVKTNFGTEQNWVTKFYIRASMESISFGEKVKADAVQAKASHRIKTRYKSTISEVDRLKIGTRLFNIEGINNLYGMNREMTILVSEEK